jgi:hypothetical protein
MYPQLVVIVGTYSEDGKVDGDKLSAISYDPMGHGYFKLGGKIGNAFSDGKKLM